MKRSSGDEDTLKKKVRFAESQNEIFPIDNSMTLDADLPSASESSHPNRSGEKETEWLEDVKTGEEVFFNSGELDGDVPLEPFNLDEERRFGTFEDDGFYVENKEEKAEASDAWLASDAAICSIDVLRKHQEQQKAMMEADKAPKMSLSETVELKKSIVAHLMPRETVLMGLRRLAGTSSAKGTAKDAKSKREADMKGFEELTELADALLNAGEMDAYSMYKEEFQHSIKSFLPTTDQRSTNEANAGDMFAEESDEDDNKTGGNIKDSKQQAKRSGLISEPTSVGHRSSTDVKPIGIDTTEVDFATWPISELKRFLKERHIDCSDIVEKPELVEKVIEASKRSVGGSIPYRAPDGFVYHPESGYFYNSERGLYYDGPSQCVYDPRTLEWYDANWNKLKSS